MPPMPKAIIYPVEWVVECPKCKKRIGVPGTYGRAGSWSDSDFNDWASVECGNCGVEVRLGRPY